MLDVIAVGTDGSETAARAVDFAIEIAARNEAELVALSAFDSSPPGAASAAVAAAWAGTVAIDPDWVPQQAERAREMLKRVAQDAKARGVNCRTDAREGDPADVLVELADQHNADLLVVGNRGMQRRLLGSVPNGVTHKAHCSVLVVKTT
jgi:nucleotide-binding universal stress UspA family protein